MYIIVLETLQSHMDSTIIHYSIANTLDTLSKKMNHTDIASDKAYTGDIISDWNNGHSHRTTSTNKKHQIR